MQSLPDLPITMQRKAGDMNTTRGIIYLLGASVIALAFGCVSAYHDYANCQVPCKYCVPPPLGFPQYDECVCHSDVATDHLAP